MKHVFCGNLVKPIEFMISIGVVYGLCFSLVTVPEDKSWALNIGLGPIFIWIGVV